MENDVAWLETLLDAMDGASQTVHSDWSDAELAREAGQRYAVLRARVINAVRTLQDRCDCLNDALIDRASEDGWRI